MAEPKILSIEGAAKLVRAGLFTVGELIGVTEHGGHALCCGPGRSLVARPAGIRPEGCIPIPASSRSEVW
jgi:hypothetical protein